MRTSEHWNGGERKRGVLSLVGAGSVWRTVPVVERIPPGGAGSHALEQRWASRWIALIAKNVDSS